ncbi:MAG: UDP-N-acetylglucosamine 2-epimerase (non-hydrolyzing) [Endomicrobium sp.]|jgi:UDP-N-acetylglucosamine 2-epimerase (non-hydrolysing)|nr:UDP-N-acetylglucosamine 2-epimerase (non-hydrolyzing) [Endomicrobium sp.]
MNCKKLLIILGTRPEVIKLAPLILELSQKYKIVICNSQQQKDLTKQTLAFFGLKSNINLNVMTYNQKLNNLQAAILTRLSKIFKNGMYDAVVVQGDTMTAFCGALAAFYNKTPIFHVEAGLRSKNLQEPFPEEAFRQMISRIADLHFAPTIAAKQALLKENVPATKILISGNTGIDALYSLSDNVFKKAATHLKEICINNSDKIVLVTIHRRENHGLRLKSIVKAIDKLSKKFKDYSFIIPVHPNPNVRKYIYKTLRGFKNIKLIPPVDYPVLVILMKNSKLVLTDSGGIQEEAPSFGVPVLVLRNTTERNEGIKTKATKLVGTDTGIIAATASRILEKDKSLEKNKIKNPYGDGKASKIISKHIDNFFGLKEKLYGKY